MNRVIKGEFAKPRSDGLGRSLFDWPGFFDPDFSWNGSGLNPTEIAKRKDFDDLQGWDGDKIVYSRAITAVGKAHIMEHFNAYGGPEPPPIDHLRE